MIQQHCQVKLIQCPNHFEICLIRLHDCHVNVGFRLDVRHGVAHLFEKNSADRDKVSNLDGKLCQKTVAVSSVRPLEKFIELSANFLLIVFPNVIQVKDVFLNNEPIIRFRGHICFVTGCIICFMTIGKSWEDVE